MVYLCYIIAYLCCFSGGRDKDGKMFGKGVVEYENGDIIAGMFKVCNEVNLMFLFYLTFEFTIESILLFEIFSSNIIVYRKGNEMANLGSQQVLMELAQ